MNQSKTLRGADRGGIPFCWFIAGCQLLNTVDWDQCFHKYAKNHQNVVAKTINFINDLTIQQPNSNQNSKIQQLKPKAITSYVGIDIVNDICDYVNNTLDFSIKYVRTTKWRLKDQHDAHEFLGHFFRWFINVTDTKIIPQILKKTTTTHQIHKNKMKQIKKMQEFIRTKFVWELTEKLTCVKDPKVPYVHDGSKEKCIMYQMKLQPTYKTYHLQELFNKFFSGTITEIRNDLNCKRCQKHHNHHCNNKITELNNEYMLIQLTRINAHRTEERVNTKVQIDKHIVVECNSKCVIFQPIGVLNHESLDRKTNSRKSGHCHTDKYFNGKLYRCDDQKIEPIKNFDSTGAYIVMLKRYQCSKQEEKTIIDEYRKNFQLWQKNALQELKKERKKQRDQEKKKNNDNCNTNNKEPPNKKRRIDNKTSYKDILCSNSKKKRKNRKKRKLTNLDNLSIKPPKRQKKYKNIEKQNDDDSDIEIVLSNDEDSDIQVLSAPPKKPQPNDVDSDASLDSKNYDVDYYDAITDSYILKNGWLVPADGWDSNDNDNNQHYIQQTLRKKKTSKELSTPNTELIQSLIESPRQHYQRNYQSEYQPNYRKQHKQKTQQYNQKYHENKTTKKQAICTDENSWIKRLFNSDQLPSDAELKNANYDVIAAVYRFLLMRGIRKDPRKEPKDVTHSVNLKNKLDKWKECMNPNVPIHVCGLCGCQYFMAESDGFKLFEPNDLQLFEANDLPDNSKRLKAMHLLQIDNVTYHFAYKGITKDNKVIVCKTCQEALGHARTVNKAPNFTIKHYDLGKYPSHLKPLKPVEKLAIARAIGVVLTYHMKPIRVNDTTIMTPIGFKGHTFCIKISYDETIKSIVEKLPRTDISNWMSIKIYGDPGMGHAALKLAKKTHCRIRLDVILNWLKWLKDIGNPYYQKIELPDTEEKERIIKKALKTEIKQIWKNVKYCDSRQVNEMAEQTRANVQDSKIAENDQMKGSILRNVFVCKKYNETHKPPPIHVVTEDIQKIMQPKECKEEECEEEKEPIHILKTPMLKIRLKNELYNEYTENHALLSMMFPYIFYFGLDDKVWKKGTVPAAIRRSWFQFYDRRCARERDLIFLMFNQCIRHKRNTAVSWQIKQKGKREKEFIKLCNEPWFEDKLNYAIKDPTSKQADQIQKLIEPLIKITDRKVPWSALERNDTVGILYSMMHFFNVGTHFITISPCMRHHALAIRLTYTDKAGEQYKLPEISIRTKAIINDPVAATLTFYRLIKKFFAIIVGLPLDHFTERGTNIDTLLSENKDNEEYIGVYGKIRSAFGVIEEQTGGSLHFHGILFGGWDIDVLRQHIHKPEMQQKMADLIDSQITCEIPESIKKKYPVPYKDRPIYASEPYPEVEEIENEAAEISTNLSHHTHSFTCWDPTKPYCRLGMPQPWAPETYWAEIHCDPVTNKPSLKFEGNEKISAPPDYPNNGDPFEIIKDTRKIVCELKKKDEFEQLQPPQNPLTTVCVRCNTSIQQIAAPGQARTAFWYIAKYCSKNLYDVERILPLLLQSTQEAKKYGSKAEDNGSEDRVAKLIIQKTANKGGYMEASDQQCAAVALDLTSYFSTHKFEFTPIKEAVIHYNQSQKNKQNNDEIEDQIEDEVQEEIQDKSSHKFNIDNQEYQDDAYQRLFRDVNGKAISISKYDKYLNRGKELKNLCLYVYTAIIGTQKLTKKNKQQTNEQQKENSTNKKPRGAGRPPSKKFFFRPGSKPARSLIQVIKQRCDIPRLTGKNPPEHPGPAPNKENCNAEKYKHWCEQAKTFVTYYSLLFLPLNENGLPFEPTQPNISILPWNDKNLVSWNNFWKIVFYWDVPTGNNPTTKFYKRSLWQIFKNMVDNLRQANGVRRLLRDWRFQSAKPRPDNISFNTNKTGGRNYDNEDRINDILALKELLRARCAADKTGAEDELAKMNIYLKKQLNALQRIDIHAKYKTEKKAFPTFNFDQCQQMEYELTDIEQIENIEENIMVYSFYFKSHKFTNTSNYI